MKCVEMPIHSFCARERTQRIRMKHIKAGPILGLTGTSYPAVMAICGMLVSWKLRLLR